VNCWLDAAKARHAKNLAYGSVRNAGDQIEYAKVRCAPAFVTCQLLVSHVRWRMKKKGLFF
jgi:hypothetical protein